MAWALLFIAGLMEIGWAVGLKYTEGFTRLVPSVLTLICMVASIGDARPGAQNPADGNRLCGLDRHRRGRNRHPGHRAVRRSASAARIGCIGLIVAGIVGLKLAT